MSSKINYFSDGPPCIGYIVYMMLVNINVVIGIFHTFNHFNCATLTAVYGNCGGREVVRPSQFMSSTPRFIYSYMYWGWSEDNPSRPHNINCFIIIENHMVLFRLFLPTSYSVSSSPSLCWTVRVHQQSLLKQFPQVLA